MFYYVIEWLWKAAPSRIYVIAKMLIATCFLKWKQRDHIPVWLCCVVLKAGFFCGSITPGLLTKVIVSRSWKCWYCTEVLEKYRIKCCSVLIHVTRLFLLLLIRVLHRSKMSDLIKSRPLVSLPEPNVHLLIFKTEKYDPKVTKGQSNLIQIDPIIINSNPKCGWP